MWGVSIAGEGKQRRVAKEMVQEKVQGEEVQFSFSMPRKTGEEVREYQRWCISSALRTTFYISWTRMSSQNNISYMFVMRDEKEERKKQARSTSTSKQII